MTNLTPEHIAQLLLQEHSNANWVNPGLAPITTTSTKRQRFPEGDAVVLYRMAETRLSEEIRAWNERSPQYQVAPVTIFNKHIPHPFLNKLSEAISNAAHINDFAPINEVMPFERGDTVRVVNIDPDSDLPLYLAEEGVTGVIEDVDNDDAYYIEFERYNESWWIHEDHLRHV